MLKHPLTVILNIFSLFQGLSQSLILVLVPLIVFDSVWFTINEGSQPHQSVVTLSILA